MVFTLKDRRKDTGEGIQGAMLHIDSQIEDCERLTYVALTAKIDNKSYQFDFSALSENETAQLIHMLKYRDLSEVAE